MDERADIDRIVGDLIDAATKEAVTQVAVDLHRRLVMYTPVDTGRARAGWIISKSERTARFTPPPGRYNVPVARVISSDAGSTIIGTDVAVPYEKGKDVFVTNNVPYIEALDNGHSQQAPQGFSERAVNEVVRKFSSGGGS